MLLTQFQKNGKSGRKYLKFVIKSERKQDIRKNKGIN